MLLEMELGITGGEEDGVDNSDANIEDLYTKPEEVNRMGIHVEEQNLEGHEQSALCSFPFSCAFSVFFSSLFTFLSFNYIPPSLRFLSFLVKRCGRPTERCRQSPTRNSAWQQPSGTCTASTPPAT